MNYTVSVETTLGQTLKDAQFTTEKQAVSTAKEWAATQSGVYISYFRKADGQHGYINPDGAGVAGKDWSSLGK